MINELIKNKKNQKGQGLLEVIVSLALLVGGIIGALTLASLTIKAGTESRERVQAALLVQEGIEIIKNNRDTNWLKKAQGENVNWDDNLRSNENFPNIPSASLSENGGSCGGEFDKFRRQIIIEDINQEKKRITCTVTWTDSSGTHSVRAYDFITNWQKNN